jgi:hypothetical protein
MQKRQTTLSFSGTKLALQKGVALSDAERLGLPAGTDVQIDPSSRLPSGPISRYCKLKISIGGNKDENAHTIEFAGPTTENSLGRIVRDVTNAVHRVTRPPPTDAQATPERTAALTAEEIVAIDSDDDEGRVVAALRAETRNAIRQAYSVKEKYAHAVRAKASGNPKAYFERCKIAETTGKKWLGDFRALRVALAAGRGNDQKLRPICTEYHALFTDTYRFWSRWADDRTAVTRPLLMAYMSHNCPRFSESCESAQCHTYNSFLSIFKLTERRVTGVAQLVPEKASGSDPPCRVCPMAAA